jgi:hypothetical protein
MTKIIIQVISWLSLAVLILLPICFLAGKVSYSQIKTGMLMMTAVWFITASLWMRDRKNT